MVSLSLKNRIVKRTLSLIRCTIRSSSFLVVVSVMTGATKQVSYCTVQKAEQTSNGTVPPSTLHGGPTDKTAAICTSLLTGQSISGSYVSETVTACATRTACTYCHNHIYQLALTLQSLTTGFVWH